MGNSLSPCHFFLQLADRNLFKSRWLHQTKSEMPDYEITTYKPIIEILRLELIMM